jgi:probable O-glycosylation ligase (exosortase A-associated)
LLNLPRTLRRARPNLIVALILIQAVLLLLSCLTAFDTQIAQTYGLEYAKVFFIGLLASLIISEPRHIRFLAVVFLLALGYLAFEVNYTYLVEHRLDFYMRGYDALDNNGIGLLLAMALPFAFVFVVTPRPIWQKGLAAGLGLLLMHAIMLSYSRGAMLSSLVGGAWLLLRSRQRLQTVAIVLVLALAIPFLAGRGVRERFFSTNNYQTDASANSRLESWGAAWRMAQDRPLLGFGIRNANLFSQAYGADRAGRTIHSIYLQIAADSGLPAMANYILIVAASLYLLGRARRACLRRLDADPPPEPGQERELGELAALFAAFQASLVIFTVGAAFLSVEVLEASWLVIVVAGVGTGIVERYLATLPGAEPAVAAVPVPLKGRPRLLRRAHHPRRRALDFPAAKGLVRP